MFKLILVAEIDDAKSFHEAQAKLDAFREAVLPAENYGVVLYQFTADEVAAACKYLNEDKDSHLKAHGKWNLDEGKLRAALEHGVADATQGQGDVEDEPLLNIEYQCPACRQAWTEQWTSACDSTCPKCGLKNIEALSWDEAEITHDV